MRRLIVISNRLPAMRPAQEEDRSAPVGGLASALHSALRRTPGSLWFGWNGRTAPARRVNRIERRHVDGVDLVGVPLTEGEHEDHYQGFCNEGLWPMLHCSQGRIRFDPRQEARYRSVNARFAAVVRALIEPEDLVWVHDYHLILLGRELRKIGWQGRLGFFLHTPMPPVDIWQVLPHPEDFLDALLEYDVIGFHTSGYLENYVSCARRLRRGAWDGGRLVGRSRTQQAEVYPIGIEPRIFLPGGGSGAGDSEPGGLTRVVRGRRLIFGVDRLDYTKGIPERILALEDLFRRHAQWKKKVSFVQVAAPSRSRIPDYVEQKRRVDLLVGRVNGELAEHDWVPIRYLYRSYPPETLARFYRDADVGLVTPLRDGMNLVAKEFVAAQEPRSPGVLVLSRFAGAAEGLPEAVLVNPFIPSDTADGIARALAMPIEERRERHAALLRHVLSETADDWSRRFVADLEGAGHPDRNRPELVPGPLGDGTIVPATWGDA